MLKSELKKVKITPISSIAMNEISRFSQKRSTIRSSRSMVIDLIPLNQAILVEISSERKN